MGIKIFGIWTISTRNRTLVQLLAFQMLFCFCFLFSLIFFYIEKQEQTLTLSYKEQLQFSAEKLMVEKELSDDFSGKQIWRQDALIQQGDGKNIQIRGEELNEQQLQDKQDVRKLSNLIWQQLQRKQQQNMHRLHGSVHNQQEKNILDHNQQHLQEAIRQHLELEEKKEEQQLQKEKQRLYQEQQLIPGEAATAPTTRNKQNSKEDNMTAQSTSILFSHLVQISQSSVKLHENTTNTFTALERTALASQLPSFTNTCSPISLCQDICTSRDRAKKKRLERLERYRTMDKAAETILSDGFAQASRILETFSGHPKLLTLFTTWGPTTPSKRTIRLNTLRTWARYGEHVQLILYYDNWNNEDKADNRDLDKTDNADIDRADNMNNMDNNDRPNTVDINDVDYTNNTGNANKANNLDVKYSDSAEKTVSDKIDKQLDDDILSTETQGIHQPELNLVHEATSLKSNPLKKVEQEQIDNDRDSDDEIIEEEILRVARSLGWIARPCPKYSPYGAPILRHMFLDAQAISDSYFYGYSNGDILFGLNFIDTLDFLQRKLADFKISRLSTVKQVVYNNTRNLDFGLPAFFGRTSVGVNVDLGTDSAGKEIVIDRAKNPEVTQTEMKSNVNSWIAEKNSVAYTKSNDQNRHFKNKLSTTDTSNTRKSEKITNVNHVFKSANEEKLEQFQNADRSKLDNFVNGSHLGNIFYYTEISSKNTGSNDDRERKQAIRVSDNFNIDFKSPISAKRASTSGLESRNSSDLLGRYRSIMKFKPFPHYVDPTAFEAGLLMVGSRSNFNVTDQFGQKYNISSAEYVITNITGKAAKNYSPYAIDYFITTGDGYPWHEIPDFVVGRAAYDNWLIANALIRGIPVIDLSKTILALHQTDEEGNSAGQLRKGSLAERFYNVNLIGRSDFPYELGRTVCATHETLMSGRATAGERLPDSLILGNRFQRGSCRKSYAAFLEGMCCLKKEDGSLEKTLKLMWIQHES